jgi:hypothetical protein
MFMPIIAATQRHCIYMFQPEKEIPVIWTDEKCYDLLDHLLYLAEQGSPPFHISLCCGLDKMIEKLPYDYDEIRKWIVYHPHFVQKVWGTICLPIRSMV